MLNSWAEVILKIPHCSVPAQYQPDHMKEPITQCTTTTNQNEPAGSEAPRATKCPFSPSRLIHLCKLTLDQQAPDSLELALSLCPVPLQKLSWAGSRQDAKQGCNSQLNRWHTPFLSLLGPQRLHPWCHGAPKSVPIKTPMRCVEGRGSWGELNVYNPTVIKHAETKEGSMKY